MGIFNRSSDDSNDVESEAYKGDGHTVYQPQGGQLDQKADEAILDMLEKPQS